MEDDVTRWQHWWNLNQAPFLRLKSHVVAGGPITGQGDGTADAAAQRYRVSARTIRLVIIPALLEALRKESSDDIQSSCMVALAKIGDPEDPTGQSALAREVQNELRLRLVSPSQELSETAALSFGIMAQRENIGLLVALLESDVPRLRALGVPQIGEVSVRTRAFAAYGLGLIGAQAGPYERLVIVEALRRMLEGDGRTMASRDVPVACLAALGIVPLAIDARDNGLERRARDGANGAMTSRQDQVRFLLEVFADESRSTLVRAHAPTALGRLLAAGASANESGDDFGFKRSVSEALLATLEESSKAATALQQSAILALGSLGDCDGDPIDRSIRTTLIEIEQRVADQQARRFALIALAQVGGRPGRGNEDPLFGVETKASAANVRTYLMSQLASRGTIRPWAGVALGLLERSLDDALGAGSSDAKLALRTCLVESRAPEELGAFAIACGIVRDPAASDTLLKYVKAVRDSEARGNVAVALGMLGDRSAIAPIAEIARTSRYQGDLMRNAAIALGLLGDKELVPELIDMLESATTLSSQAAISRALGTVGDARSVEALIAFLKKDGPTELARSFAAVALGLVADKEDLPWNAKLAVGSNYRASTDSLINGRSGVLDIL